MFFSRKKTHKTSAGWFLDLSIVSPAYCPIKLPLLATLFLLLCIISVILYVTCMRIVLIKKLHLYEETSAEPDPNPNTNVRFAS